jgi:hypothetical protein
VILLENSNEWNLSPTKEGSQKKDEGKGARIENKRGKTSFEKIHVSKREKKKRERERMRSTSCWEGFY